MAVHVAAGFTGISYSLSYPRIGWRKISGTVSALSAAAGYAAANAVSPRTDSFWRPTATTGWLEINAGTAQSVSYAGIAAHDLGTRAATVVVEYFNGSVWVQAGPTVTPANDGAILVLFAAISAARWRLRITASAAAPTIGVIQFGAVTELPRKATFAPSISFERARSVTYAANITEGGHFAGRTVVRTSLNPKMAVDYLPETWIASEWDAFALHAETLPFFVADRPGDYAQSVAYAWTNGPAQAQRSIANATVANSVELELTGFLA